MPRQEVCVARALHLVQRALFEEGVLAQEARDERAERLTWTGWRRRVRLWEGWYWADEELERCSARVATQVAEFARVAREAESVRRCEAMQVLGRGD